jgi:hypothetical protein
MHIRCAQCRSLTQVQIPETLSAPLPVVCSGCGRRYRLAVNRPRGTSDPDRYRRAKAFAEQNRIDLASAYSVLEGLMTLEEARGLRAPGTPPSAPPGGARAETPQPSAVRRAPAPAASTPLAEQDASYDPGFAEAVRDGCLSVQQAVERGDRRALALRMAQRHRLPMALALRVADNRITIRQALAEKAIIESREPPRPQTSVSHGVWNFTVVSLGGLILGALAFHVVQVWSDYLARNGGSGLSPRAALASAPAPARPAAPAAVPLPPPPLTVPRTDTTGQLVEVVGPDPRSVLIAFCTTGRQAGQRQAVEIAPSAPPSAGVRFGVFRSTEQPGAPLRAIRIRQDPRSGRWVAGDGRAPITTEEPPPQVPGMRAVPLVSGGPATGGA